MIQIGIVMPCRLRYLRLGEKAGTLSDAVQALTGLDRLSILGDFISDLCNGNYEFRRYARRENQPDHKSNFEKSFQSAERRLPKGIINFDLLYDLRSPNLLTDIENAKTLLSAKASEHLQTLSADVATSPTVDEQKKSH
jgi:hypothetical protein